MFNLKRRQNGQAVVEFALVLPLFILLFISIIDFGWAFHSWTSVQSQCIRAARAGTKRLHQTIARDMFTTTTHASTSVVLNAFWESVSPLTPKEYFSADSPKIDITLNNYRTIRVEATYDYHPIIGAFLPAGWRVITMHRIAEEQKE